MIDDDKARQHHAEGRAERAENTADLIADEGGGTDGDGAGGGLGNRDDLKQIIAADPSFFDRYFIFNDRNHRVAAPEGDHTDLHKGEEKL